MAGFRFGYNLNRVFGLMGEVAYSPTTYVDGGERAHVVSWSGHAVFYLSLRGARPFILVGGGQEALTNTVNLPKTGERIEPDNDGGIHIGMGVKFDVARDLSLRIEYRAVQADGPDNEFGIIHQFSAGISLRLSAHH